MDDAEAGTAFAAQLVLQLQQLASQVSASSSTSTIDLAALALQLETLAAEVRRYCKRWHPKAAIGEARLVDSGKAEEGTARSGDDQLRPAERARPSPDATPVVVGLGASTSYLDTRAPFGVRATQPTAPAAGTGDTAALESSLAMRPLQNQSMPLLLPLQQVDLSVPDILYVLPLTDIKQYFWDELSDEDQRSLRCTCRAMQQLAQQGLVTSLEFDMPTHQNPPTDSLPNITLRCMTRLLWCAHHYQALQQVHLTQLQLSPFTCSMLKTVLRAAPRLRKLAMYAPVRATQDNLLLMFAALAAAPQLTELELTQLEDLTTADALALTATLRSLLHLKHINLTFGRIADANEAYVALMASIAALPALQQLSMGSSSPDWRFTLSHMEALTSSPSALPQLKELRFYLGFQDARVCERLALWLADGAAPGLGMFAVYNFSHGDELIAQLNLTGAWRAMCNLRRLAMQGVTNAGVAHLATSVLPPSLTRLDLSWSSGFTADGAVALAAALPRWTKLQELWLSGCSNLKDVGAGAVVEALIRAPHMRQVKVIDMQYCGVSKECAQALLAAWRNAPHLAGARLLLL